PTLFSTPTPHVPPPPPPPPTPHPHQPPLCCTPPTCPARGAERPGQDRHRGLCARRMGAHHRDRAPAGRPWTARRQGAEPPGHRPCPPALRHPHLRRLWRAGPIVASSYPPHHAQGRGTCAPEVQRELPVPRRPLRPPGQADRRLHRRSLHRTPLTARCCRPGCTPGRWP